MGTRALIIAAAMGGAFGSMVCHAQELGGSEAPAEAQPGNQGSQSGEAHAASDAVRRLEEAVTAPVSSPRPQAGEEGTDSSTANSNSVPGKTVDAGAAGGVQGSKAEEQPGTPEAEQSGGKGGIRSVLRLFTGQGSEAEGPQGGADKDKGEESQKRVNELGRLATSNIDKGRISEAIRNINELIALKPYEANYHFALGLCYRREGKYKEALKKYQDVLDLGGPKALVAVLKAEAHATEGDREKVMQLLREAATGGRNIITDVGILPALSVYQQDTEFIKLALQLEKFGVTKSKRQDPFTNPFPKFDLKGAGPSEAQESVAALTPEDQEKLLLDARKTYERVKFYIKLEDEAKAMKAYVDLRSVMKKKDLITIPKIANDMRILMAQLEGLEIEIEGIRLKYYYNQAQVKLKQMKELFADGEYLGVETVHSEVVKLTQEMQHANKNYKTVADQILAASTRWNARAQVRREFDQRKPNIQGIVIAADGKLALLNNRLVRQGETMDDFRVIRVESNKVTFRYKGEDIPLLFRRY